MHPIVSITDRSTSPGWFLALVVLLGLTACDRSPSQPDVPRDPGRPVQTANVEADRESDLLRLPGVTRAIDRSQLAFLHGGHLAERHVRRGQTVQAGQALAVLHNPALMPGVSSAEARVREIDRQLEQLQRETRRLENIHERGLVATEDLDRVRSRRDALLENREQARAQLDEAREQMAEATLRAPFAGQIVELYAEPGQFVGAGQPILSISAPGRLEVELKAPARIAHRVAEDDPVMLRLLDSGIAIEARITEVGPAAPGQPATIIATLPETETGRWRPGQALQAELAWTGETGLRVPLAALVDTGAGSARVFRVRDNTVEAITVEPAGLRDGWVRINGELQAGDEVVIAGHGRLLDGERVRVLP